LRAKGEFCRRMLLSAVDRGDAVEAVERLEKLCSEGLDPDSKSFNAVVTLLAQQGDLEKAEAWFQKPSEPSLHPELADVTPDGGCYIAMVVLCAERADIPRAEKYANAAQAAGCRLDVRAYQAVVRACIDSSEPRRAHVWASAMLAAGCTKFNKALMSSLVKGLADTNNAQSADYWLTHMADMGQRLDKDTYNYVRRLHPMEIVPTGLSGEGFRPRPPETRPATVGQLRPATAEVSGQADLVAATIVPRPMTSTMPSPRRTPRSVLAGGGNFCLRTAANSGFNNTKLPRRRDAPETKKVSGNARHHVETWLVEAATGGDKWLAEKGLAIATR